MNQSEFMVNTIAPIKNVTRFTDLVTRLVERPPALPGFGVFSGKAGLGKTFAATYAINKFRAHYVECDFTWTQKAFCKALMIELGLLPTRTPLRIPIYEAVELIGNHIADNPRRPLIIDEADFLVKRRMTGDARRDLNPMTQHRMQELAVYLWRTNPLANRLIELPVAYLLAEGVKLSVEDEEAQEWINAFWDDPINCMDIKLPKKVRELAIYGEQCWPTFVNEINGDVRLGYLDPGMIETVVTDPDNVEQPIGIVTQRDNKGNKRRYRIIISGPEDCFSNRTQEIRETFGDGECFYFTVNDLSNASRGTSYMMAQLDWLDGYDQAMFGELERWDFMRAFIWDVELKGATPEEVKKRAGDISVPSAGGVRVHNDMETWSAVTPELNSGDGSNNARLFRNQILGGSTLPEHWYGGGGDVNRATAGEMGEPTIKVLSMRQRYWGYILVQVATYQIRQKLNSYYGSDLSGTNHPEDYKVKAEFAELTARDTSKYATALQQVITGCAVAVNNNLLALEHAVGLIILSAGQFGLVIDPVDALEKLQAAKEVEEEKDSFPGFPEGEEEAGE